MVDTPRVTMAMRDLDRLKCIQGVIDRQLRLYQAAERLNLTTRQVRRLVRRYEQEGPVGLISRHRNRPSNRRIKAAVFNHVSMNFSDVVWTGVSCRHIRGVLEGRVTQERMRDYWRVISPSAYLERLGRESLDSLLIWAGHDTTFRPEFSRQVLDGFIQHGIGHRTFYLPCGHYTTAKPPFVWMDGFAMSRFLLNAL